MKNRIVVWGTNEQNERVLIALELKPEANKVNLLTFPEAVTTDEFTKKMMEEWRAGSDIELPDGHSVVVRDLSVTESLLPENLKVGRSDVINRAQSEWHFVVLSNKMSQMYAAELAELKEKIASMQSYDKKAWEGLKSFWDKVNEQVRDRNLFRDHSDSLRDGVNELFEKLKTLRTTADASYKTASAAVLAELNDALDAVEAKLQTGGARFATVFDDLKALQSKFRQAKLTREDSDKAWNRLDAAFKQAKERRFGPSVNEGTVADRHEKRLTGLLDAIKKMQYSVDRDVEELRFQEKKVAVSEGQLEAQIRTAKIRMVKERLTSKQEKLDDMKKTLAEVQGQITQAKARDAQRAEKDAERAKFEAAKVAAKERLDAEAKSHAEPKNDSMFGAIGSMLSETMEDLGDTVKAIAEVAGEKLGDAVDSAKETAEKAAGVMSDTFDEAKEIVKEKAEQVQQVFAEKEEKPADSEVKTDEAA